MLSDKHGLNHILRVLDLSLTIHKYVVLKVKGDNSHDLYSASLQVEAQNFKLVSNEVCFGDCETTVRSSKDNRVNVFLRIDLD